jgi:UDP-N-acetyl-D-glucosamine dehydrogenase
MPSRKISAASYVHRVRARKVRVGVVGLGYVGLPLVLEFAKKGFPVMGIDIDEKKTSSLSEGRSYIRHIESSRIKEHLGSGQDAVFTTDFARSAECDALLICVPTPLLDHKPEPDLKYVEKTAEALAPHIRRDQLIVLESTTYPGTTEEVLIPILESASGLKAGRDFFVAYSPEREDPNNMHYSTATIPKVVGGIDAPSLKAASALYCSIVTKTVEVSDCRTAEASKLMENIFRSVNIALVNELKVIYAKMGIDVWEVIKAASTKPFGFMPFYPGPGLGGHCIPIDPFYLSWKAKQYGAEARFIELAGEINTSMHEYVTEAAVAALKKSKKRLKGAKILLVGLAYKKNVDDDRESPTYHVWQILEDGGAKVSYYDPFCPIVRPSRDHSRFAGIKSVKLEDITKKNFDAAIILTAHDRVKHDQIAKKVPLVIDARNACKPAKNVIKA